MQFHLNAIQALLRQLNELDDDNDDHSATVSAAAAAAGSSSFLSWFSSNDGNDNDNKKQRNKTDRKKKDQVVKPKVSLSLHVVLLSPIADSLLSAVKSVLKQQIARDVDIVWSGGTTANWQCDAQIYVFVAGMGRFPADQCLTHLHTAEALLGDTAHDRRQFIVALSTSSVESFPSTAHGIPLVACRADPSTLELQPDHKHFAAFASAMQT